LGDYTPLFLGWNFVIEFFMIAFGLSAMGLVIHIVYVYGTHWTSCIFGKQRHFAHEEESTVDAKAKQGLKEQKAKKEKKEKKEEAKKEQKEQKQKKEKIAKKEEAKKEREKGRKIARLAVKTKVVV
jgi:hypothetical protein